MFLIISVGSWGPRKKFGTQLHDSLGIASNLQKTFCAHIGNYTSNFEKILCAYIGNYTLVLYTLIKWKSNNFAKSVVFVLQFLNEWTQKSCGVWKALTSEYTYNHTFKSFSFLCFVRSDLRQYCFVFNYSI